MAQWPQAQRVRLSDVPVELYWEMEHQAGRLVRELAAAPGADEASATRPSYRVTSLLEETRERYAAARALVHKTLQTAARRGQPRVTVEIDLPRAAAETADELIAALEAADEHCRRNGLAELAACPEVAALRRLLHHQIVAQLRSEV